MAPVTPTGSVQKIEFGRCIGPETRPVPDKSKFQHRRPDDFTKVPTNGFRSAVKAAALELARHDIELEQGPYADKLSHIDLLVEEINCSVNTRTEGKPGREDFIQSVSDVVRPFDNASTARMSGRPYGSETPRFLLNTEIVLSSEEPLRAGDILADAERHMPEDDGSEFRVMASIMEPFFLATSIFRRLGFQSYPALATVENSQQVPRPHVPVMTILEPENEVILRTIPLLGEHPPMDSLLLIGDDAMEGVAWALLAEKKVKDLALEMLGSDPAHPARSVGRQLSAIADILAESHRQWPFSQFIDSTIGFLTDKATEVLCVIGSVPLGHDPRFPMPQEVIDFVYPLARERAEAYAHSVADRLNAQFGERE